MNTRSIKTWFSGTKALTQWIEWRDLRQYFGAGVGLEVVALEKGGPHQTILVISSHPGDEIYGCGGALAHHCLRGDAVSVVFLTDGSRGTPSGSRDKSVAARREQEALASLHSLGEVESHFWRFPDTRFEINKTTLGLMKGLLEKLKPEVIYVPWYGNDNCDSQQAVPLLHQVIPELRQPLEAQIWQYEIETPLIPNRIVPLGDGLELKVHALDMHRSHHRWKERRDGILGLNAYRGAFWSSGEPAEAFFALSVDRFIHLSRIIYGQSVGLGSTGKPLESP